jgi:UDP-N-acetylglucosamine 2-epimerase
MEADPSPAGASHEMAQVRNTYGDGRAAERVVDALLRHQGS